MADSRTDLVFRLLARLEAADEVLLGLLADLLAVFLALEVGIGGRQSIFQIAGADFGIFIQQRLYFFLQTVKFNGFGGVIITACLK